MYSRLFILALTSCFVPSSTATAQLRSLEMRTEVRLNLAVTTIVAKFQGGSSSSSSSSSGGGSTTPNDPIDFSMPLPIGSVLSNFTIGTRAYHWNGIAYPVTVEELQDRVRQQPKRAAVLKEYDVVTTGLELVYAGETVTYTVRYEELLTRRDDLFTHQLFFAPCLPVRDKLLAEVVVVQPTAEVWVGSYELVTTGDLSSGTDERLPRSHTVYASPHKVHVAMRADPQQLLHLSSRAISGKFVLKFGLRPTRPDVGHLMISSGYFVYNFAPRTLASVVKNVAFVIDCSGSMDGYRLVQAKMAFKSMIDSLSGADRFSVTGFSSNVSVMSVRGAKLLPGTEYYKMLANNFIDSLNASADTDINSALLSALALLPDSPDQADIVLFLTDGQPNVGTTDLRQIFKNVKVKQRSRKAKAHLMTVGFGPDVNSPFLEQLARQNAGFYLYVPVQYMTDRANEQITDFFTGISKPVMRDVIISFPEFLVDESSASSFSTYYQGCELQVAGKLVEGLPATQQIQASVYGRTSQGSVFFNTISDSTRYPAILDQYPIPGLQTSVVERIYVLRTLREMLAEASSGNKNASEKVLLWTRAQMLSTKYNFLTSVTELQLVNDASSEMVKSTQKARDNYKQALENLAVSDKEGTDVPPPQFEEKDTVEGADGDPHIIARLRNWTLCFDVSGADGSWLLLLNDTVRGVLVQGQLSRLRDARGSPGSFFTTVRVTLTKKNATRAPETAIFTAYDVAINLNRFMWGKAAAFKHGRTTLVMDGTSARAVLNYGPKIGVEIIRHRRRRPQPSGPGAPPTGDLQFLGVYLVEGSAPTPSSSGLLGKRLLHSATLLHSEGDKALISLGNGTWSARRKTVVDNSSMEKVQCWHIDQTLAPEDIAQPH